MLGFRVWFERPEERFAYLVLDSVHLMLEEAAGPGRRFRTAPLEHPYGRGANFMIKVADASALCARVEAAGFVPYLPLEDRWYRQDQVENGNRQFGRRRSGRISPAFLHRSGQATSLGKRRLAFAPHCAISSSARLVVRGPKNPIVAITTPIAAAMKTKTPNAPKALRMKAMTNDLKITESRLQE